MAPLLDLLLSSNYTPAQATPAVSILETRLTPIRHRSYLPIALVNHLETPIILMRALPAAFCGVWQGGLQPAYPNLPRASYAGPSPYGGRKRASSRLDRGKLLSADAAEQKKRATPTPLSRNSPLFLLSPLVGREGFEPSTPRLKVACSTPELPALPSIIPKAQPPCQPVALRGLSS